LGRRLKQTVDIMVGDSSMRRYPTKWEHTPDLAAKYSTAVESQPTEQKISAGN